MPRRCCVPACRGNYTTEEKVSSFHFPRDEDLKGKWIRAIHRDNFTPTIHSVVSYHYEYKIPHRYCEFNSLKQYCVTLT